MSNITHAIMIGAATGLGVTAGRIIYDAWIKDVLFPPRSTTIRITTVPKVTR